MLLIVLIIGIVIGVGAVYLGWPYLLKMQAEKSHYNAKPLLNASELALYNRLVEALPGLHVFTKVSLPAFLGNKNRNSSQGGDRINSKMVDYLVCRQNLTAVAVVEIEESRAIRKAQSGKKTSNKNTSLDIVKHKALAAAGIPVINVNPKQLPGVESIQSTIQSIDLSIQFNKDQAEE